MSDYPNSLEEAVTRASDGSGFTHSDTSLIRESLEGETVWTGNVETFTLLDHAKASECFAWCWEDRNGETQNTVVLGLPPVESPRDAVQLWILHTEF